MNGVASENFNNKSNSNSLQNHEDAKSYKNVSRIQQDTFHTMLSIINIEKGWKILDIGCGTGNNTVSLINLVGDKGKVFGIDPIPERIDEASSSYQKSNLQFFIDAGKNSYKYGNDFDLVIANYVMHWMKHDEKKETFGGIYKCLKPGGTFIFSHSVQATNNFSALASHLPESFLKKIRSSFHHETRENLKKMALENGFKEIITEEKKFAYEFQNSEEAINWLASSMHMLEHQHAVDTLTKVWVPENVSFLYNDKGRPEYRHGQCFYICKK